MSRVVWTGWREFVAQLAAAVAAAGTAWMVTADVVWTIGAGLVVFALLTVRIRVQR